MNNTITIRFLDKEVYLLTKYNHACILQDLQTGECQAITHDIAKNIIETAQLYVPKKMNQNQNEYEPTN